MSDIPLDFGEGAFYSGLGAFCKHNFCAFNFCTDDYAYLSEHLEVYAVAYNIQNFRVLWEITSDGTTGGNNISATNVAATSSANYLKYDSLETYCLFSAKTTDITIDAEQNIYVDTVGILGHNLTAGATINLYASSDGVSYSLMTAITVQPSGETNTILCASTIYGAYRYWKISISDLTNSSNIHIGRIVAGQATVFSDENFTSQLSFYQKNYVEEENMNGFSSYFRQRALRNVLSLTFENLSVTGGNYTELKRYFLYARNTLRALIIPDPTNPYRYSVWSKLVDVPKQDFRDLDGTSVYSTIQCTWDEGR